MKKEIKIKLAELSAQGFKYGTMFQATACDGTIYKFYPCRHIHQSEVNNA